MTTNMAKKLIVNIVRLKKYNPSLFRSFKFFGTDKHA